MLCGATVTEKTNINAISVFALIKLALIKSYHLPMCIRILLWFGYGLESCCSEIAMQTERFLKGVWDLKGYRSETAM